LEFRVAYLQEAGLNLSFIEKYYNKFNPRLLPLNFSKNYSKAGLTGDRSYPNGYELSYSYAITLDVLH
jgi:hypothetical protein